MNASIRARVAEYYGEKVREHGATARGVDWNSTESQRTRFDQLLRIVRDDTPSEYSLLDYGCGYGAILDVLAECGGSLRYTGYDVSDEMIEQARSIYLGHDVEFTSDLEALAPCDYVVASGILNVKLDTPVPQWRDYVLETLDSFHRLSTRSFAFNALTSYSDPEHMRDDLFYADPTWLFDHCKRTHGGQVALLHDYGLYEFTILVRKAHE